MIKDVIWEGDEALIQFTPKELETLGLKPGDELIWEQTTENEVTLRKK